MEIEKQYATPKYCAKDIPFCWHEENEKCAELDTETSPRRLYALVKDGTHAESFHASKNPNLKPRHRRRIVKRLVEDHRHTFKGALGVILNPALTAEELRLLCRISSRYTRQVLAGHAMHRLTFDEQILLAASSEKDVHTQIILQEGLPQDVYESSHYYVKFNDAQLWMLAENSSVATELLEVIIRENRYHKATLAALCHPNTPVSALFNRLRAEASPDIYDEAVAERKDEVEAWLKERGFDMNVPFEWLREILG